MRGKRFKHRIQCDAREGVEHDMRRTNEDQDTSPPDQGDNLTSAGSHKTEQ